ncbi:uncharacterized protein K452DRAFT_362703 [Aplosporella prunicola CBS 121167]|uniref:Receptor L-domain domain-containing protein n=1 Tax=Aplosporella prunicola CBS 121167 TaxID=1176127 RepID=A0A6A6AZJ4_9PEZI|nr:uncharacterized protein K452DRAFT_362703 [Aplosporella prunicola CBS 121167]KAF2136197.1 hypothetical protein K452DRAFT_362703 [Aplosporella prunicola CBS 121167]
MVYSTKLRSIAASGLLVSTAAAAGCSAPKGGVLVVDVEEALDLASCKTFDGSIAISKDVWDSISLDGLEEITGSLSIEEGADTLTYFSANSLTSLGSLGLHEAPILTGFDLPSLNKIDSLSLSSLPLLWDVDFGDSIEKCSSVEVRDTTLTKLELDVAEPDTIIIEENDFLWSVSVSSTTVNEEISIGANGNALDISFPQLESASKVTMSNASALSFPALTSIDSLVIKDSYIVDEGFDFSLLETISGDLEISGVWDLSSLSLSSLKSVGGDLKVWDSGFSSVNFESLETVGGDMELSGDIEEVSMDELKEVFGSFDVSGASNAQFDCSDWSSFVKGKSSCDKDNKDEPPAEVSVSVSRSTPVASIPTDIASTPALSTSAISIPATPTPIAATPAATTPGRPAPVTPHSTPGAALTPKPLASTPVVISLQTPIVETITNSNGSVTLTTETWATSTPGVGFGTPTPTPSNLVPPFTGVAASVRPFVGMVGFIFAVAFLGLL